jgi:hypothetical protein
MDCPQCGYAQEEGIPFCSNCGAALSPPAGGKEGASSGAEAHPSAPAPATGSGGSRTPLLIGIIAVLIVAAVVLVLVFTVFKGDGEGGDGAQGDTSDPAAAVDAFFQAIVDGDVDALIAAIDPGYIDEFEAEYGREYRGLLEGFFIATNPEGLEITGLQFEVEEEGDGAVVSVVAGTATYLDANGEEVREEVDENALTAFEVIKVDGRWFVSMSTFPDWWYYLNAVTGDEG